MHDTYNLSYGEILQLTEGYGTGVIYERVHSLARAKEEAERRAADRHYVCDAHAPTEPRDEETCPCCEAVHQAEDADRATALYEEANRRCIALLAERDALRATLAAVRGCVEQITRLAAPDECDVPYAVKAAREALGLLAHASADVGTRWGGLLKAIRMLRDQDAYEAVLEQDEDGDLIAQHPDLPGCMTHGETADEALERWKDVRWIWLAENAVAALAALEGGRA